MEAAGDVPEEDIKIREYPDPFLRNKSRPVKAITDEEVELFEKMTAIMRESNGIGLAAPQIGVLRQLIVADAGKGLLMIANPVILKAKGLDKLKEGCLSVPGVNIEVKRASEIILEALDEKGRKIQIKAGGLMARILQHEVDHLKGKLIVDYISFWDKLKMFFRKKSATDNHG